MPLPLGAGDVGGGDVCGVGDTDGATETVVIVKRKP